MIPHKVIPHDTSIMKAALTLAILALTINGALCLKHGADDVDNLDNVLNENKLVEILPRYKRDLYNLSDFIAEDPIQIAKLREQALAADRSNEGTTEWEPILYKFGTTLHSSEVGRMSTWYKEISDFVQAYRYNRNRRTTPDTRPENPDDTWTLSRPKFKGDFVGKPFHDPPWRLDQLKYLHCHIDDCKAWFEKSDYRSYVLHMYDHFFNHRNFYVTWHPQQTKQNFTCYNKSCHEVFEEPGDFFSHVHEHLIEEKVTDRTLFTTERTIPVADFFSNKPTTTPKPYVKQSCYMCGKIYYTKDSLDKHLIWHAFNGSFYFTAKRLTLPPPHCVPCELQFSTEDKLVKHREKIHPQPGVHLKMFKEYYGHDTRNNPDPMGFFCPMCPKRYFLPFNMEKHIAWHGQHSPHDEILPIGRPRKAFILFGNTLADEHTTKAEKIFHDPPRIAALLAQCRKELDEIDVNYTTPAYPQPEYVNVDSDLTSEREDSRTQEHKIPLTEEIMDLDPNGSRYLEAMLRKPPKFCKKCHYITNDTLEFNRHYREHCWEVALFKHRKRSEIYDRMDALYEEADRIRRKEWNQGLLQNPQADFRIRERRSVTDQNELDEKTKRELDEIREGLSKIAAEELQPRERRDLSAKESAEFIDALSRELLERRKREVDFDRIQMEIRREMFTVPYQMGQKCESCNDTFMDKAAYVLHLKEHIGNQSFFEQGWKDPPTPYRSLEFTGYPTAKQRNGSEEARYRAVGRDIISEFQDFEIGRRRGVDNRTYEQFRRDRAIELGLKFGLLRTRQTTLPPPPPKPSSAEVNARLNAKLNDVKAKLKAYQDRKTKGQTGNLTDASKEIENKIEDLKRKMDEIKQKYNATKKRARRSPMGAKIPKDRLKNQFMAEMKQKEKMAKKKGITMDSKKTDFDFFGGENILDRTTAGKGKPKRRGRRELKEDIKRDFEAIKNNTFLEMWDKDINDVISTRKPKPKPSPKTTETPFPDYVDFENGTTISLLEGLKLMKCKINVVLERYRQIHNLKGVTWKMELLKKYNMLEPLEEIKNKTAELNKTEIVRRIAEFEYFDQWEPDQTTQPPTTLSDAELKQKKEHEKYLEGLAHKFQALKVELHSVIMKHFTGDELEKMDPGVKRKIEGLVKMTNETGPLLKREKRDVETTTWVFTPRPYFEMCSQCSVNFTRKTEYYQHEFQHILNEDFLAQAEATLNADQKYEQWKAERDNSTTPYAIDLLLSKKTIPMFNDSNDEAAIKQYFITKMQENYAYGNRHKIKADMAMRKATSPIIDLDAFTFEPINRTEVVEVFNRVSLYYARQDQEQRERELKEREAQEGAKPARRRRHVE